MKKLTLIITLLASITIHAQDRYLFTNTFKSISPDGVGSKVKTDSITWLFNSDKCTIDVITETEDLVLSLESEEVLVSDEDATSTDVYRCDIGTIYVDFIYERNRRGEFLQILWIIDDYTYIFKMK